MYVYVTMFIYCVCCYDAVLHMCVQPISFPGDVGITQIAHHSEGKHFLALSHTREVFAWGSGENGQLGLGDNK